VTTTVGNEGLDLVDNQDAMIADTATALADAVVALWRNPERCAALAAAGQAVLRDRYSEDAARRALQAVLTAPMDAKA